MVNIFDTKPMEKELVIFPAVTSTKVCGNMAQSMVAVGLAQSMAIPTTVTGKQIFAMAKVSSVLLMATITMASGATIRSTAVDAKPSSMALHC